MALQVKVFVAQLDDLSSNPWEPRDPRRELVPTNCSLTAPTLQQVLNHRLTHVPTKEIQTLKCSKSKRY